MKVVGAILFLALISCPCIVIASASNKGSEQQELLYKLFLNMEIPKGISDFKGEGTAYYFPFPEFLSHGYFQYKPEPEYFTQLANHDKFLNPQISYNKQIAEIQCDSPEFPQSFSYWEKDGFRKESVPKDKKCFMGIFFRRSTI